METIPEYDNVILSTTSTRLGAKIKDIKTAKEMWDIVKSDATTKSTLYLLDAEDELASMKLGDTEDLKTHLSELKEHFQLMVQRHNNLIEMGLVISDTRTEPSLCIPYPNPIVWHSRQLQQPSELVLHRGLQVAAK